MKRRRAAEPRSQGAKEKAHPIEKARHSQQRRGKKRDSAFRMTKGKHKAVPDRLEGDPFPKDQEGRGQ
jgi:hypothetical protein